MPKQSTEPVLVGCELLVRKGDNLLLGLRGKGAYGAGTWALPGGHLEFGERAIDTACREALEELGAKIPLSQLRLASVVDSHRADEKEHHIHLSFEVKEPDWEPHIMEPESCDEWRYFDLNDLPENIFTPHKDIINNYINGRLYYS